MEEAGNLCRADWVCSADEQRMLEWEREHFTPNKGYTTSRPYIDGGAFGAQTSSWQKFTPIGTTPATPKNTPPRRYKSPPKASRLYIRACKFNTQLV